jgi:hypothetical protein
MKKIFRYLFRDKVDFILLLICIALMVKNFPGYAVLGIFVLYIFSVMWRMGNLMDIINENVTVKSLRQKLGLYPVPGVRPVKKLTIFGLIVTIIFWIGTIGVLVYFALVR